MTSKYTNKNGVKLLSAVMVLAVALAGFIIISDEYNAEVEEVEVTTVYVGGEGALDDASADGSKEKPYATIAYALANTSGTTVVELKGDVTGDGWSNPSERDLTINFNGYTFDMTGNLVGSKGTESQVFQLLKDSNVVFNNGTITTKVDNAGMIIQNYSNLTLNNMVLDGKDLSNKNWSYTLSCNNGEVKIIGSTSIVASVSEKTPVSFAFDACWNSVNYPAGAAVTLDTTGTIDGDIEVGDWKGGSTAKTILMIKSGTINGDVIFTTASGSGVEIDDSVSVDVVIPSGTTASGSVTFGKDNKATFTGLKAGENGIKLSKGSVKISGTIDASATVSIEANGTVKLNGVEVTGTAGLTVTATGEGNDIIIEDLTLGTGSSLRLADDTNVTVTGSLDATGASISTGTNATLKADSTATITGAKTLPVEYAEGSIFTYNGVDYTVFKTTWAGTPIYYGISCGNIEYANKVIDEYDVDVLSICITNGYKLTNQTYALEDITTIPENKRPGNEYRNAGTYENALKIQVTFNENATGDAFTANKKINLVILPTEPEVDFSIDAPASETAGIDYEWNMYNTVITDDKITYTYNGIEYTFGVNAPEGVTVTYTVKDFTTDAVVEKDISELVKGKYKIALSFTQYGNYSAITTASKVINVTDTPDESKIIFKDIDAEADLFDKVASQLQEGVEFTIGNKTAEKYPVTFSGQFIKVTGYTGFSSVVGEQTGYYLAFSIDMSKVTEKTTLKITKSGNVREFTGSQLDGDFVIFLGNPGTFSAAALYSFEMEIDYDGAEGKYSPGIYTISADTTDGKVTEIKMVIELYDDFNSDVIKIANPQEYLVLPNGAGTERNFIGWEDENKVLHAAGSVAIISEKLDKDGNLRIVFTAVYEEPAPVETPVYNVYFVDGTTVTVKTVEEGKTVEKIDAVPAEGLEFVGWYANGEVFDFTAAIEADTIVSAVYKAAPVEPVEPVEPIVPAEESEKFVVSTSVVDDEVVISIISLDGGYLAENTEATVTFTVLEETVAFGQTVYKPVQVTETVTVTDSKPIVESESFDLETILGDRYAVISVVSYIGTTNYGFMNIDYKN